MNSTGVSLLGPRDGWPLNMACHATAAPSSTCLRNRIALVLDWATARKYRTGENLARWRGHLDKLLPKRSKVQKVRNNHALPYAELPGFMEALRSRDGTAPKALEFIILTGARESGVTNARWQEIDLEVRVWLVPGDRMKSARDLIGCRLRTPLCAF